MTSKEGNVNRQDVFRRVVKVFQAEVPEKLHGRRLDLDTRLQEDLDLDSGYFIGLLVAVEEEFDLEFAGSDVSTIATLGDVVDFVMALAQRAYEEEAPREFRV
jgi:acyl carrier protein